MEVQLINSFSITDGSEAVNIGRGHLNGVLIGYDDPDAILEITFAGKNRTTLVESIELSTMSYINTYLRTVSTVATQTYVDLGSIYLQHGDEIRMIITSSTGSAQNFEIWSFSESRTPFVMNVYENILDSNTSIIQSSKLFSVGNGDASIAMSKTPYDDYSSDLLGYQVAAWAKTGGLVAAAAPFGVLYDDVNDLIASPWVRITGAAAANIALVNLRKVRPLGYVDASTVENTIKLAERLAKMERENPQEAEAYRHGLGFPKSFQLMAAVNKVS